ncbi:4-hydroxy-tetrahydrodipicolinate synthase [Amphibacillus sediminis]|uniref:4-hydroxy-tetrahydrodipicolinate synthase n=1 Tax=Amphibacillus sediminis TaxID=360185 RepID=UPI00082EDFBA|nr:4-hydroxy-tetrahydrodipicolinate synthase [Amphibacillus sediminis]
MDFGRLLTAMVTPFDQTGAIDYQQTVQLIEHLLQNGSDGLVVNGTTGESPTLSTKEKLNFLSFVVKHVNGRVPIIAGTGTNNTQASVELTQQAEAIGVDGIMLVTPYYNKPSQEGMYQHFTTIAQATKLPVILYSIPGRSVVKLDVATVVRLSQQKNIVAIKDATGDLDAITRIIKQTPSDFHLYSGDDNLLLPILAVGGHGIISVTSHVAGNQMQALIQAFLSGNVTKAQQLHHELAPLVKAMFIAPNPAPVKEALKLSNIPVGSVRLPLIPLDEKELAYLKDALNHLKTLDD